MGVLAIRDHPKKLAFMRDAGVLQGRRLKGIDGDDGFHGGVVSGEQELRRPLFKCVDKLGMAE